MPEKRFFSGVGKARAIPGRSRFNMNPRRLAPGGTRPSAPKAGRTDYGSLLKYVGNKCF
jgi:hypothetical protein